MAIRSADDLPLNMPMLANKLINLTHLLDEILDPHADPKWVKHTDRLTSLKQRLRKMREELCDAKDKRYEQTKALRINHDAREAAEAAWHKRDEAARERLAGVLWRLAGEIKPKSSRDHWRAAINDIDNAYYGRPTTTAVTEPGHRQPPPRMLERFTDERGRGYVDPKRGKIYTHEKVGGLELSDDDLDLILNWSTQVHHSVITARDTRLRLKIKQEQIRRGRK